jgi:hypothetical protein
VGATGFVGSRLAAGRGGCFFKASLPLEACAATGATATPFVGVAGGLTE